MPDVPSDTAQKAKRCRLGTRGAVYVEFLGTFMPITLIFLGLVQSAGLYTGKLVTAHAAVVGARAAAVVLADDPQFYDKAQVGKIKGKREDAIVKAVSMTLKGNGSLIPLGVEVQGANGKAVTQVDQYSYPVVTVKVKAAYHCGILHFSDWMICGWSRMKTLEETATLPVQMAPYEYPVK
jgi:hypothetical protein